MALFRKKRGSSETMKKGARLITAADPKSPVSEQFRTVRTNIKLIMISRQWHLLQLTLVKVNLL